MLTLNVLYLYTQSNHYTCQLFLTQRCEIFIRVCEITSLVSENAGKPYKSLQRQSERFQRCSKYFRISIPAYPLPSTTSSHLKIREYCMEELSFTHTFQSVIGLSTNYTFTYYIFSIFFIFVCQQSSDIAGTTHIFQ